MVSRWIRICAMAVASNRRKIMKTAVLLVISLLISGFLVSNMAHGDAIRQGQERRLSYIREDSAIMAPERKMRKSRGLSSRRTRVSFKPDGVSYTAAENIFQNQNVQFVDHDPLPNENENKITKPSRPANREDKSFDAAIEALEKYHHSGQKQPRPFRLKGTKFILNNPYICKYGENDTSSTETSAMNNPSPKPVLLMMVQSRRHNFKEREIIRNTYGTLYSYKNWDVRIVFLLGKRDRTLEDHDALHIRLAWEFDRHGDLILGPFYEHNNTTDSDVDKTYQHLMGIRWAIRYCSRAKYAVKVDDSYFVNTLEVVDHLIPMMESKKGSLLCSVLQGSLLQQTSNENEKLSQLRPWPRDGASKNFVDTTTDAQDEDLNVNGKDVEYCGGGAYIASMDALKKLYVMIPTVPFYKKEHNDIYVTGRLRYAFLHKRIKIKTQTSDSSVKQSEDKLKIVNYKQLFTPNLPYFSCSFKSASDFAKLQIGFHKLNGHDDVNEAWCLWQKSLIDRKVQLKEHNRILILSAAFM